MTHVASARRRALSGASFLVLGSSMIQFSAGLGAQVFAVVGPLATSAWRFLVGAVVSMAFIRPHPGSWRRTQWTSAIALGVSLAFMSQCFFQAIARIPLGSTVAIKYLGPFLVSALGRRTPRHLSFVALAALGVVVMNRPGEHVSFVGIAFAAAAAAGAGGESTSSPIGESAPRKRASVDSPSRSRSQPC